MSIKIEEILSNKAFDELDIDQKNAYINLSKKIEGKTSAETVIILMDFAKTIPKGKPFNKQEQEAMLAIVLQNMEPAEQEKFKAVMDMVNRMKK